MANEKQITINITVLSYRCYNVCVTEREADDVVVVVVIIIYDSPAVSAAAAAPRTASLKN